MNERYSKQINIAEIGAAGQKKLSQARVLCIGAGGLGSSLLLYLAAAGVGTLGIMDHDVIELTNLQRQILYQQQHLGKLKVAIASQQIAALNPTIQINTYPIKLEEKNARDIMNQYDIVADCSDNFLTKYLINDICYKLNKPSVYASVFEFQGHCTVFLGNHPARLRCLFPTIPDSVPNKVLGVVPGIMGIIQATEIIKWILQIGDLLSGRLLTFDALRMGFEEFLY